MLAHENTNADIRPTAKLIRSEQRMIINTAASKFPFGTSPTSIPSDMPNAICCGVASTVNALANSRNGLSKNMRVSRQDLGHLNAIEKKLSDSLIVKLRGEIQERGAQRRILSEVE